MLQAWCWPLPTVSRAEDCGSLLWPAELPRLVCHLLLLLWVFQILNDLKCPEHQDGPLKLVSYCSRLQACCATHCLLFMCLSGAWCDQILWLCCSACSDCDFVLFVSRSASLVMVPSVESVMKVEMGRDCFPHVTAQEHWAPYTRAAWKNGYPPPTQVTVSSATQNLL